MPLTLDSTTQTRINSWLTYDDEMRRVIEHMLEEDPEAAVDAFYKNLEFGTGGLRGIMGIGTNRVNIYTIRFATQGLANYIKKGKVFVSYDSRHNSRLFAEETAKVLAGNGIHVYLTKELRPTPLISFGCRHFKCDAAVMITASHNPPEYNGYKVYWNDGGQLVPPHDVGMLKEVNQINELEQVKCLESLDSPLIEQVGEEIDNAYIKTIAPMRLCPELDASQPKIVFTSLHGTGITLFPKAAEAWGFSNVSYVEEESTPDGSFPLGAMPNPELRDALKRGIALLEKSEGDILLATDPDADRIGVAVRHNGKVQLMKGNQIAALCLAYICENRDLPENAAFIKTIGTTELMRAIAKKYGKPCFSVHTGFKYIAELIREWEDGSHTFIFGGEESYGYLYGTQTRDKDGILSGLLICEMALKAKLEGLTLVDKLHQLYKEHGLYWEKVISLHFGEGKENQEKMERKMAALRSEPPSSFAGIKVERVEDFLAEGARLAKSNVLIFWLKDGSKLMIRPSGTEPNIKVYCGVVMQDPEDIEGAKRRVEMIMDSMD